MHTIKQATDNTRNIHTLKECSGIQMLSRYDTADIVRHKEGSLKGRTWRMDLYMYYTVSYIDRITTNMIYSPSPNSEQPCHLFVLF